MKNQPVHHAHRIAQMRSATSSPAQGAGQEPRGRARRESR